MSPNDLHFIACDGPSLNFSAEIRTLTMINAAATRPKTRARRKARQPGQRAIFAAHKKPQRKSLSRPVEETSTSQTDATTALAARRGVCPHESNRQEQHSRSLIVRRQDPARAIVMQPYLFVACSDFEKARSACGLDIRTVATFTSFNVGGATIVSLGLKPYLLPELLKQDLPESFIHFIPHCYGRSQCLTTAVDSVLSTLRNKLERSESSSMLAYAKQSKALRSLQDAMEDPAACRGAEVMCAAQLLLIREVMEPYGVESWLTHLKGCIALTKFRTPNRYNSDFEKALLLAYAGPAAFHAILDKYHCHMAEFNWTAAYRQNIVETEHLTARSTLFVDIRCLFFKLPGLLCDISAAVESRDLYNNEKLAILANRSRAALAALSDIHERFCRHCDTKALKDMPRTEQEMRRKLRGGISECFVVILRFLATTDDAKRIEHETQVQLWAQRLLKLQGQDVPECHWVYSVHEVANAQVAVFTRNDWLTTREYACDDDRRLAIRDRFRNWDQHRENLKALLAACMAG